MSVDSIVEPKPFCQRLGKSITTGAISCWEWMAEFFSNLWDYICDAYYCVSDWIYENICCSCCKDSDTESDQKGVRAHNVQRNYPKAKVGSREQPNLQQVTVVSKSNSQKTVNLPTFQPSQSLPPTIQSPQNVPSIKPTSPQRQQQLQQSQPHPQPPQIAHAPSQPLATANQPGFSEPPDVFVEPPKIDFVETGSIFGDRKRGGIDHNMLLMENGRFRSPGTSKVVHGPGGRNIRVSFVTGFPSIKSIESNRSLAGARKSYESMSTSSDTKLKKMKSTTKSYKSVNSNESKDDSANTNNTLSLAR